MTITDPRFISCQHLQMMIATLIAMIVHQRHFNRSFNNTIPMQVMVHFTVSDSVALLNINLIAIVTNRVWTLCR